MGGLVRVRDGGTSFWGVHRDGAPPVPLDLTLAELLALPLGRARAAYQAAWDRAAAPETGTATGTATGDLLAPVDEQEVWAAGVTYLRSRQGRREESGHARLYDMVYDDDRPELFFKATAPRVVGPGAPVGIRADSAWNVPEAEVGLVVNRHGEIFGYTVGNDMSSRDIEGANPLYLPQAKVYDRSCALGPAIVPVWQAGPGPFGVTARVLRDGRSVFAGSTSTAAMARDFAGLARWLYRALEFPAGAVLLTGTGVVPERDFTLLAGDVVEIEVERIGRLSNPVTVVGSPPGN